MCVARLVAVVSVGVVVVTRVVGLFVCSSLPLTKSLSTESHSKPSCDDNDNDTLREVRPTIVRGLAFQA